MSQLKSLENELLGACLVQPELMALAEAEDFTGRNRPIFETSQNLYQQTGDLDHAELCRQILAEKNDGNIASYIGEITHFMPKKPETTFRRQVGELRKQKKFLDLSREVDEQRRVWERGGRLGFERIGELTCELKKCEPPQPKMAGTFYGTNEEFLEADIPVEEMLCDPILFRGGLVEVGGMKGTHKSFFANSLALHLASGRSPFLNFSISKPRRVLLIQQEISIGQHRQRMETMTRAGGFDTGGRLFPYTTTGCQLKLEDDGDLSQIKDWIAKCGPDVLILDPLSSFEQGEENNSKDRKRTVSILNELKATFGLCLLVTHHFSSKVTIDNPIAPQEVGGWFRGHSAFPDAADTLIGLHRLPGQRENKNLVLPYEDYNLVEIQLRNGKWPKKFAIEFDSETFLLKCSCVWEEINKKILPGEILDFIDEQGGEVPLKALVEHFQSKAQRDTIRRAIREEIKSGRLEEYRLPGKGRPIALRRLFAQEPSIPQGQK